MPSKLREAAGQGDVEQVKQHLARMRSFGDLNSAGDDGCTALHAAAEAGNAESIRALLLAGASPACRDRKGRAPLHFATGAAAMLAHEEHVDAVVALLEGGANPAEADAEGRTPLHEAAGWGHTAAIRVLVRAGADVGSKRAGGFTALHDAARMGRAEAIAALLELGAVADSPCDSLQTPLYLAAACKDQAAAAAAVRALLAGGASPNSRTVQGVTPLIAAATLAASQALLAGGADATLVDKRGNTALHAAAKRWARWEGGQTAPKKLHGDRSSADCAADWEAFDAQVAAQERAREDYMATVRVLLQHGAKAWAANKKRELAVDVAAAEHPPTAQLLQGILEKEGGPQPGGALAKQRARAGGQTSSGCVVQ